MDVTDLGYRSVAWICSLETSTPVRRRNSRHPLPYEYRNTFRILSVLIDVAMLRVSKSGTANICLLNTSILNCWFLLKLRMHKIALSQTHPLTFLLPSHSAPPPFFFLQTTTNFISYYLFATRSVQHAWQADHKQKLTRWRWRTHQQCDNRPEPNAKRGNKNL